MEHPLITFNRTHPSHAKALFKQGRWHVLDDIGHFVVLDHPPDMERFERSVKFWNVRISGWYQLLDSGEQIPCEPWTPRVEWTDPGWNCDHCGKYLKGIAPFSLMIDRGIEPQFCSWECLERY